MSGPPLKSKGTVALEIARILDLAIEPDDEEAPVAKGCTIPWTDPARIDVVLSYGTEVSLRVESVRGDR